ncbi:MAG: cytochrome d ubiquinol oxidase subunit II [Anaerolineae bacterium]|nr:cytochrome d ubiquinol oxidase subunit II [Anaerolineae bacterium]
MDLNTLWFILITVLFTGFFVLEGFDYGVGILLPFLGKKDEERRIIINTIGPFWDSNEVWMITAGGALFAAFPQVYATLASGAYLAIILLLVGLILRGVGFEFRSRYPSPRWRTTWDWLLFVGSLIPALLWGAVVGNLMRGLAIDQRMIYWGGLLPLLNPFALWAGLTFVALFVMYGANYLALRTSGEVEKRAKALAFKTWIAALVVTVIFVVWAFFATDILTKPGINGLVPAILAAVALLLVGYFIRRGRFGWAFTMGALTLVLATVMVFAGLYPRILISTLNPAWSLTIYNASSSPYTLRVMTIIALIFVPIVLAYLAWTYKVFSERVTGKKLVY